MSFGDVEGIPPCPAVDAALCPARGHATAMPCNCPGTPAVGGRPGEASRPLIEFYSSSTRRAYACSCSGLARVETAAVLACAPASRPLPSSPAHPRRDRCRPRQRARVETAAVLASAPSSRQLPSSPARPRRDRCRPRQRARVETAPVLASAPASRQLPSSPAHPRRDRCRPRQRTRVETSAVQRTHAGVETAAVLAVRRRTRRQRVETAAELASAPVSALIQRQGRCKLPSC